VGWNRWIRTAKDDKRKADEAAAAIVDAYLQEG
jgi:hypothetical protein